MRNITLILVCSFLFCACVRFRNYYGVEFRSNLPYKITETRAYFDGRFFASAGDMDPVPLNNRNTGKVDYGIRESVPDEITLKWKEPDGSMREVSVVLKDKVPSRLRDYTIILTITETGAVDVSLKKNIKVL